MLLRPKRFNGVDLSLVLQRFNLVMSLATYSVKKWFSKPRFSYHEVIEGLKDVYRTSLLPIERKYLFHDLHSPQLTDQDFDAKPIVIFLGQYSTGKTTLIKYLVGRDWPGLRIGPEPTTDRFLVLARASAPDLESVVPGNALVSCSELQMEGLSQFGNSFLKRIQCAMVHAPLLEALTLVDTPGVLAGEKQRVDRGYDFEKVLEWFAKRADRVVLLFDANKLDISDELQRSIQVLNEHEEKMRVVLNKSDSVDCQSLLRVYGALMWSLGKVLKTPEVSRVYVGSFWENALVHDTHRTLFHEEEQELFHDIYALPKNNVLRKMNDFNKRIRQVMVNAFIVGEIHERIPTFFGKDRAKEDIMENIEGIVGQAACKHNIPSGDLPNLTKFKDKLKTVDFNRIQALKHRQIYRLNEDLKVDMAELMNMIDNRATNFETKMAGRDTPFDATLEVDFEQVEGGEPLWILKDKLGEYETLFNSLNPVDGKLLRSSAKIELEKSKLPNSTLAKIWTLADIDEDGQLDSVEFALAMHLVQLKTSGKDLPKYLPRHMIPPSKRPC